MEIRLTLDATPALLDVLSNMTNALAGTMGVLRGLSTPAQHTQQATAQTSTTPAPIVPQQPPAAQEPTTNVVQMPAPATAPSPAPVMGFPITPPATAPMAPVVSPVTTAPVSEPDYTHEQLGRAAAAYMDKAPGNQAQLINLLQQFGVQAITHLATPAQRTAFANGLRGLGAQV